jgi:hypothetical protein
LTTLARSCPELWWWCGSHDSRRRMTATVATRARTHTHTHLNRGCLVCKRACHDDVDKVELIKMRTLH